MQHCLDVITFPMNLLTTSGLSILLHGVISLPGTMSYDNLFYFTPSQSLSNLLAGIQLYA